MDSGLLKEIGVTENPGAESVTLLETSKTFKHRQRPKQ